MNRMPHWISRLRSRYGNICCSTGVRDLRELYKAGDEDTLVRARTFLEKMLEESAARNKELLTRQIIAVLLKIYRLSDDAAAMLKTGLRSEITVPSAEVCMEFGYFFLKKEDYPEAAHWFYTAAFESESEIDIALALCGIYRHLAVSLDESICDLQQMISDLPFAGMGIHYEKNFLRHPVHSGIFQYVLQLRIHQNHLQQL